jgi:hypothetical protein
MTPKDALIELLRRVAASHRAMALINDDEISQWPDAAVAAMKTQRLLSKARPAASAICPGCERDCVMPVRIIPTEGNRPARAFIVCDKRNDINRVTIPLTRLTQWQCSAEALCAFIAASLALRRSDKQTASAGLWEVGMATGYTRSQMLRLQASGVLLLVAGGNSLPLVEFAEYQDGAYSLNEVMIRQLVDAATTADNRYTPSNARREVRKLETATMYSSWQQEFRKLKRKYPNRSDVWYSLQIAKLDIAQNREAPTIKKHMKF